MTTFVGGIYEDPARASKAVDSLIEARFSPREVSVLVRKDGDEPQETEKAPIRQRTAVPEGAAAGGATGAALGAVGVTLVATGAVPGLGLLAGGPLLAALEGLGVGAAGGGLFGALAGLGWWKKEADIPAEDLEDGMVLVGVRIPEGQVADARSALERAGALRITRG